MSHTRILDDGISTVPSDSEDERRAHSENDSLIEKACADMGCDERAAIAWLEWFEENCKSGGDNLNGEMLAALRALESKERKGWHVLIEYQSNQKTSKQIRMSTRMMAMELGHYTAAGADNPSELARLMRFKKQTTTKVADTFQSKMELGPRPGQRSDESCKKMADAVHQRIQKNSYEKK